MLNRCKIYGADAVSCIIGGIFDRIVKTGATAANHATPESLYTYLANLNTPGNSRNDIIHRPTSNKHRMIQKDDAMIFNLPATDAKDPDTPQISATLGQVKTKQQHIVRTDVPFVDARDIAKINVFGRRILYPYPPSRSD